MDAIGLLGADEPIKNADELFDGFLAQLICEGGGTITLEQIDEALKESEELIQKTKTSGIEAALNFQIPEVIKQNDQNFDYESFYLKALESGKFCLELIRNYLSKKGEVNGKE